MKEKKVISMNDISRMAGVSVATVSRIINQNGRYSAETERRVREIIEKYHYMPNMAAKGLKTHRTNVVGVIVPDITNEFFARIVQEIQSSLRSKGYMAFICNTREDETVEQEYMDMLSAVNMAGLIFISGYTGAAGKNVYGLPAIYIDRMPEKLDGKNALVIESDNYGGARLSVQELYEKGCRKIACIHSSKIISTHTFRYNGYRDQLAIYGLEPDEALHIKVDEVSFHSAYNSIMKLIGSGVEFDGVFCATDWLALGTVAALQQCGIDVPGKVKVVGFDDISVAELTAKPLTTIHQQMDVLGQIAAEEIVRLIEGSPVKAQRIQIGVSLVRRATT
jgi:LacI family transcriptional regulator